MCRGELYPCETDVRLCDELESDEEVEVDMDKDVLTVLSTGKQYPLKPIGDVSPPGHLFQALALSMTARQM